MKTIVDRRGSGVDGSGHELVGCVLAALGVSHLLVVVVRLHVCVIGRCSCSTRLCLVVVGAVGCVGCPFCCVSCDGPSGRVSGTVGSVRRSVAAGGTDGSVRRRWCEGELHCVKDDRGSFQDAGCPVLEEALALVHHERVPGEEERSHGVGHPARVAGLQTHSQFGAGEPMASIR